MYYLCLCLLVFLAIIGTCQLCRGIAQAISNPKNDREIILIEPIGAYREDAEYILRDAAKKVMWMGKNAPDRVVCLDIGMDRETERLCRLVCAEYPFMEICTKKAFAERLSGL